MSDIEVGESMVVDAQAQVKEDLCTLWNNYNPHQKCAMHLT